MDGALGTVIAIAVIVFNIIGIVWFGIGLGHPFLVPVGYIIALIIIVGKINETVGLVVTIVVGSITLILLIIKIVNWIMEISDDINQNAMQRRLLHAIKQNDKATVQQLIEKGARVNGHYDGIDKFPLQIALENCDEAMISLLLEKGADVNNFKENGKPFATEKKATKKSSRFC